MRQTVAKKRAQSANIRQRSSNWSQLLGPLAFAAIVLTTFVVYSPALQGKPLWDDDAHITSPELQSMHGLFRIWFEPRATWQYYPLLHSAFWLEHKLWGNAVLGYHLVNLLWHLIAVWLVYRILQRLKIPGALLAAAIFAIHPVMVESVAWISEQKNTLSAVFYLSAMLTYLSFDESRKRRQYVLAIALFILGLLTKTVTATLPAALLVIFWWQRGTISSRRDVTPLIPFFLLGAVAGAATAWIERTQIGASGTAFELTFLQRGLLAGRAIWFYAAKLLWPSGLTFIYPRWQLDPAVWWQWLFAIAALITLAALFALRRSWRGPLAAWLFFCGTLFPVLGFLNVYPFLFSFVADHFQYLASLGLIVAASAGVAISLARANVLVRRIGITACFVVLCTLAATSWRLSHSYADVVALYTSTLERNPSCWLAHNNLGINYYDQGNISAAVDHYRAALRLNPDFFDAHNNLGLALMKQSANDEAAFHFAAAQRSQPTNSPVATNLGVALLKSGRGEEAVVALRAADKLQPNTWTTLNNLGQALAQAHSYDEAIKCFEHALQLNPAELLVYNDLADAYAHTNQQSKAAATLQHALDLANARADNALIANFRLRLKVAENPKDPAILKNFGFQLARAGRLNEAIEKLQAALVLKPDDVAILNGLGTAYLMSDQPSQAAEQLRRAVQLKSSDADLHVALGLALLNIGDLPAAIKEFEAAVALNPNHLTAQTKLGAALNQAKRHPEAIPHLEHVLELQPRYNEARVNMAIALASSQNRQRAYEQFLKALEIDPKDANAHCNFGKFLADTNGVDAAIAQLQQAVRLDPTSSDFHQSLGEVFAQSGRKAEAIEHYRSALRHQPKYIQSYANLAKLLANERQAEEAVLTAKEGLELARTSGQRAEERQIADWIREHQVEQSNGLDHAAKQ